MRRNLEGNFRPPNLNHINVQLRLYANGWRYQKDVGDCTELWVKEGELNLTVPINPTYADYQRRLLEAACESGLWEWVLTEVDNQVQT